MQANTQYDLDVKYIFCREYHIAMSASNKWVTQAFSVLSMLTSGTGRTVLDDKYQTELTLKRHQPSFLAGNLRRKPHVKSQGGIRVLAFGFQCEIANGIDLFSLLNIPVLFDEKLSKHLCNLLLELYSIESVRNANWLKNIASRKRIGHEIIENIISSVSIDEEAIFALMKDFHCTPAVDYLNKNYMLPSDISKLMRLCNLSRTHFFRSFKKQTNSTPFEYIKNCRLQESQNMLLCTNLSISEIGKQVGWPDPFHFSRIFKKETGLSPNNYRQQFKIACDFANKKNKQICLK